MVAIEILAPGEEIEPKLTLYFAEGAAEVWVIDPRRRTMVAYAREEGNVVRRAAAGKYHSSALGITIPLAELFDRQ
jgi:Uma2 family endonuclease